MIKVKYDYTIRYSKRDREGVRDKLINNIRKVNKRRESE